MKGRTWLNLFLFLALVATAAANLFLQAQDVGKPNYEFLPETQMAYSVAYDSFAPNPNFPDGLTLRSPPAGTIARGQLPFHYQPTTQDAIRAGMELHNPYDENDTARQTRGGFVFTNYCQVCHGPLGLGNGPVTQGGFPPPASLLAARAMQMKDGQMFHVLTFGQQNMPSFAAQLSREDRWNVILYVRTLQGPSVPDGGKSRFEQTAKVFRENCAACHGPDGTGSIIRRALPLIPDFSSPAWQMSQTEMAIVNQIDYGSHPLMPAFRYKLPQEQILALAVYVRSFATHGTGGGALTAPPTSHLTAKSLYSTFCFSCHETNGKGNTTMRVSEPELPDFTTTKWQKSRTDADLVESILKGKGKIMVPMKDILGPIDVKQMVTLVRGFEGGKQEILPDLSKSGGPPPPLIPGDPFKLPTPKTQVGSDVKGGASKSTSDSIPDDFDAKVRVGLGIFQSYCILCHGPDGKGTIMRAGMPGIPDFTSAAFHKDHSDVQILASILDGKGTLMQANRGRVTEDQAWDLVGVVRTFGGRKFDAKSKTTDTGFEKAFKELEIQYNEFQKELQKTRSKKQP